MSKKETRRAARQAFPKAPSPARTGSGPRRPGSRPSYRSAAARGRSGGREASRPLRPPTLKRAAIQGAILAVLYLILIRFIQPGTTTAGYVIFPLASFVIYTGIAYGVDRFTYQRRLRKLKGSSK